jgi:hypothetical protein
MSAGPLMVTYPLTGRSRAIVAEELNGAAEAIYLVDLAPADRAGALGRAGAVLSHDTSKELRPDKIPLIRNARLLQFTAADWVPTRDLPRELLIAANRGAGAEPMSEHVVALALPPRYTFAYPRCRRLGEVCRDSYKPARGTERLAG